MKRVLLLFLSLLLSLPAFYSCVNEKLVYYPPKADDRVYFIYMAAGNSLSYWATVNLQSIEKGATYENIGNGRVIVFYDLQQGPGKCKMLEFKAGPHGRGIRRELAVYDTNLNTASPETFEFAVSEMKKFATAAGRKVSSYVLDVWSHGNSWELMDPAPSVLNSYGEIRGQSPEAVSAIDSEPGIMPTAVVNDGDYWMNLEDFAEAIEPGLFDAVVFAECYGASVEMMNVLHDKTDYVIGSAAEMPAEGLNYSLFLPMIFKPRFDYENFCVAYYDFWSSREPFTATIAWFDCKAFDDDFIDVMKDIYASGEYTAAMQRFNAAANADALGVQYYDRNQFTRKYFDLGDLVDKIFPAGGQLHDRFWDSYGPIVKYRRATAKMWNRTADPSRFSGMTTYIMLTPTDPNSQLGQADYPKYNTDYKKTAWYKTVYPRP